MDWNTNAIYGCSCFREAIYFVNEGDYMCESCYVESLNNGEVESAELIK